MFPIKTDADSEKTSIYCVEVVVGSTLKTDIELANGGGMKSLLVLSN